MARVIFAVWMLAVVSLPAQTVEGHVVNSMTGAGISGLLYFFFRRAG
jgi:hypothetical protein